MSVSLTYSKHWNILSICFRKHQAEKQKNQNVNSLRSHQNCINSLCSFCVAVELEKHQSERVYSYDCFLINYSLTYQTRDSIHDNSRHWGERWRYDTQQFCWQVRILCLLRPSYFLQGKRISGVDGDQVSDVCHENAMLKTENDK